MDRRNMIVSTATAAAALATDIRADEAGARNKEAGVPLYYLFREYDLRNVGDPTLCDSYFRDAFLPGLQALGLGPAGVFSDWFGDQSLSGRYVLVAGRSLAALANLDFHLDQQPSYVENAKPFTHASVSAPPFLRINSTLIRAIPGLPELVLPADFIGLKSRLFELRTYEQPTLASHNVKARMFADAEAELLDASGFHGIMYGTNIVGNRLPSLTYMWVYKDLAERQRAEDNFFSRPTTDAFFRRYPGVPSSISNRILRPLEYSLI